MGTPAEKSDFYEELEHSDDRAGLDGNVKPGSHERFIVRPAEITEERKRLSSAQTRELMANFPRLFSQILKDLEDLDDRGQTAMAEEQDELDNQAVQIETLLHNHLVLPKWQAARDIAMELNYSDLLREEEQKALMESAALAGKPSMEAENLTPEQKIAMGVQAYKHVLDQLQPFESGDKDAYDEDVKDRERNNPLARQVKEARRLRSVVRQYKEEFPEEARRDARDAKKTQNDNIEVHPQYHPTNILPPPNPQLEGDLSEELE